jgi:hypothetical protein
LLNETLLCVSLLRIFMSFISSILLSIFLFVDQGSHPPKTYAYNLRSSGDVVLLNRVWKILNLIAFLRPTNLEVDSSFSTVRR